MGGNDGFNVEVDGDSYGPFTPEWETEYARRTAVVMRVLGSRGKRPVYWAPSPPPATTSSTASSAYRTSRVGRAAEAVPGARYVDIFNTVDGGRFKAISRIDGKRVISRQADGVHFTRDGAVVPARLVLRAMARDYPGLGSPAERPGFRLQSNHRCREGVSSPSGRPASWRAANSRRPCGAAPRTRCRRR